MSQESETVGSPVQVTKGLLRGAWNTLLTIYYANTVSWRFLKSGALVFFGFFLWAGGNVVLSVQPGWRFLHYPIAYGLVLLVYGPLHHLVVIPLYLRYRRRGTDLTLGGHLHLPNIGLAAFLVLVIVLGATAPGAMTIDFQSSLEGSGVDIDPDLLCVKHTGTDHGEVHCHLTTSRGIDRVVVKSGDRQLAVDEDPPFEFTIAIEDIESVVGQQQFRVILLDADGNTVRRYTRSLNMIPEE